MLVGGELRELPDKNSWKAFRTDGDGNISHWHYPSRKRLSKVNEKDNSVLTVAYNNDGSQFATAGRDRFVRVYDENTKQLQVSMGSTILDTAAGHANRVFSSCFDPASPHTLLTGGWDNTVHIWDTRSGRSERKIFGPHIAGEALDISNGCVLTGSWRPNDTLQTWDLASGKLLCTAEYNPGSGDTGSAALQTYTASNAPGLVYGATYNADGTFVVAGGSGNNSAKVFDAAAGGDSMPLLGAILGLPGAVFAVAAHESMIAVAGAFDQVYVYELVRSASSVASVVHEGFHPGDSPTARTPQHAAVAGGFSDSKDDTAAVAAAGAGGSVADRVVASLHTVTLHEDDGDDDEGDSAGDDTPGSAPSEQKSSDDFGTRSGVVGGSALAAVRARRTSQPEEGKQ